MLLQSPGGLGFGMLYEKPGLGTKAAVVVAAREGGGGRDRGEGGHLFTYTLVRRDSQGTGPAGESSTPWCRVLFRLFLSNHSPVLHAATSSPEPVEGINGSKHRQACD